ncbi:hypothetical protein LMG22037_05971 [Paraburkholderia phenoliruptrix]|uniref:Uncharacterized protein n=1 Tax=Paraburkholderia phenoliruptrix TaxID=252970 RepID=A0A6J5CEJ1_9BURK|nr:hypothetical protein LMG22037_05971 [Paraburkholderia phenoliruptrix]
MEGNWREFDEGEEWFAGRVLWVWAPSWETPRLAIADRGDDFDWFYSGGPKLEEASAEFPTHCCDLEQPAPPAL